MVAQLCGTIRTCCFSGYDIEREQKYMSRQLNKSVRTSIKQVTELIGLNSHDHPSTMSPCEEPLPSRQSSLLTTALLSCLIPPKCPKLITWSPCAPLPQHTQTYRNSKQMNQEPLTIRKTACNFFWVPINKKQKNKQGTILAHDTSPHLQWTFI